MSTKIKISTSDEHLIDVINFFDQKNIDIDFDRDALFERLVVDKKYDEIEFFLDRGCDESEFMQWCRDEDDNDIVNFILERNQDLCDSSGEYLVKLISTCNLECSKILIKSSQHNTKELVNYDNGKPLTAAAATGNKELIKLLFLNGAKIKYCSEDPLISLIKNNHIHLVKLFIDNGSSVESIMPQHLEHCIKNFCHKSVSYITNLLYDNQLPHFAEVNLSGCLMGAVKSNNLDLLTQLLDISGGIDDETIDDLVVSTNRTLIIQYLMLMKKKKSKKKYSDDNDNDIINISKGGVSFRS